MTDERRRAKPDHALSGDPDSSPGARLTVRPPFDPAEFARESDSKLRAEVHASETVRPPPLGPLPAMPPLGPMRMMAGSTPDVQEIHGGHELLGPDTVPYLIVASDDLEWFDIAPQALALVPLVDGASTLAAIAARASLSHDEVAALLLDLTERGVIGLR